MKTVDGFLDGQTQNLSGGGAFIRCPEVPDFDDAFGVVMTARCRLILVTAETVWSDVHSVNDETVFHGIGVHFKRIFNDDRLFLHGVIARHRQA